MVLAWFWVILERRALFVCTFHWACQFFCVSLQDSHCSPTSPQRCRCNAITRPCMGTRMVHLALQKRLREQICALYNMFFDVGSCNFGVGSCNFMYRSSLRFVFWRRPGKLHRYLSGGVLQNQWFRARCLFANTAASLRRREFNKLIRTHSLCRN